MKDIFIKVFIDGHFSEDAYFSEDVHGGLFKWCRSAENSSHAEISQMATGKNSRDAHCNASESKEPL